MRHTESGASGHARDCRLAGHGRDRAIKPARINDVWHSGWEPRVIMLSTFIAPPVLPVQEAVFPGVALSMLHYLYASSVGVRTVSMTPLGNGSFAEHLAQACLQPGQTVVLERMAARTLLLPLRQALASSRDCAACRQHPRDGDRAICA